MTLYLPFTKKKMKYYMTVFKKNLLQSSFFRRNHTKQFSNGKYFFRGNPFLQYRVKTILQHCVLDYFYILNTSKFIWVSMSIAVLRGLILGIIRVQWGTNRVHWGYHLGSLRWKEASYFFFSINFTKYSFCRLVCLIRKRNPFFKLEFELLGYRRPKMKFSIFNPRFRFRKKYIAQN